VIVGGEQRGAALRVKRSVGGGAPVVDGHRQIEQQIVDAGKIEVEQAADLIAQEQDVVAKQIGVDHARAAGPSGPVALLMAELVAQQAGVVVFEAGFELRGDLRAPGGMALMREGFGIRALRRGADAPACCRSPRSGRPPGRSGNIRAGG
jgi:hypothetical protein